MPSPALDDRLRELGANPYCWRRHGDRFEGDTGAPIVIGIVWTGFDVYHPDLFDAKGRTRILAVWDQEGSAGHPTAFGYGSEWNADDIDARRAAVPKTDKGTALAVLAAGNGRVTHALTGVAPEARLVLVRSTLDPWDIIDAVQYIFRAAAAAHCPAVVDLSLNTHLSSHDGTDSLDVRLDQLTGPGRIVVAAAGNEGGLGLHASADVTTGPHSMPFEIGDVPARLPDLNKLCVFLVYPELDSLLVGLRNPAGSTVLEVAKGGSSSNAGALTTAKLCNGQGCDDFASFPGKSIAALELFGTGERWAEPGVWTLDLAATPSQRAGRVDAWIQLPDGGPTATFVQADESTLVGWPACADSLIAVGAYQPASTWGDGRDVLWPQTSPGPLRDGREAIDIVAPGHRVRVPRADGQIDEWNGTSFAAAQVTGAVALLLAAHDNASPTEIRVALRRRAKPLAGAHAPHRKLGGGKLWIGAPPG